jgi:gamma-glutamyltranspeptidase/glutathione hydrolase
MTLLGYPSRRSPLIARNVVATSQPLAAQAGLRMLQQGGNAIDAAVAAAATLTVVEPTGCGLGSDAFAIVWDGTTLHGLNASGRSPRALSLHDYDGLAAVPLRGWMSVTTPGAISAWVELSRRFGSLPLATTLEPAVTLARDGFGVSPLISGWWRRSVEAFRAFPDWMTTFAPAGRGPAAGELVRLPDHARSLAQIASSGGEAFYRGELADRIDDASHHAGAALRKGDLEAHRCEWVGTLSQRYGDRVLHEIPPNGQGIAALMALGILSHLGLTAADPDSPDALHLQIEAMKLALIDAYKHVADPAAMAVSAGWLLDETRLANLADTINLKQASDPPRVLLQRGGTVYLAAADAAGRMVSFIQSNFHGFGSGIVVPGTGIALQNRGHGFVLDPTHPNRLAPAKRPFHTIIPGFLMRGDGTPDACVGIMGGAMQAQAHVQAVLRLVDVRQDPQTTLDAPRWRVMTGRDVWIEPGLPEACYAELTRRGHVLRRDAPFEEFGGGQIILRLDNGLYEAGSDSRKDGQAVGW